MGAGRARTRRALVRGFLEKISSDAFDDFQDEIADVIQNRHGVYALYRDDDLYYVGLASNLRARIKTHLRDKHADRWNRFSLYLVSNVGHVKEIESLLLRIAYPRGNTQLGKLPSAENLKPLLRQRSEAVLRKRLDDVIGLPPRRRGGKRRPHATSRRRTRRKTKDVKELVGRRKIYGFHNGWTYSATVRRSGEIALDGYLYPSLTSAARSIKKAGRINGRSFWHLREQGEYVRLRDL